MKLRTAVLFVFVLFFFLNNELSSAADHNPGKIDLKTLQELDEGKSHADIIVLLTGYKDYVRNVRSDNRPDLIKSQSSIHARQKDVLIKLHPSHLKLKHRFENIPGFSARVSREGIRKLASLPEVEAIEADEMVEAHLAQGIPLMHAATPRSLYSGTGTSIAIVDTGINYNHSLLGGGGFPNAKVVGGYDFGDSDSDPLDCHGHGTSVAGIAAGSPASSPGDYIGGVAHDAKLYALKIVSDCEGSAWDSDIVAAWDWAVSHKNDDPDNPILIINTSFGGDKYLSACDSDNQALAAAADNAVANGITLFGSSGNNAYTDGVVSPACLSSSISVGAVYDANVGYHGYSICTDATTAADMVTCYSNSADFLDILAPSHDAYTTTLGGGYTSYFGGTSAASPYAAGAGALVQSYAKAVSGAYYTPNELKTRLLKGDLITDPRNNIAKPRVNADTALYVSILKTGEAPVIDGDISEYAGSESTTLSPQSGGNTFTIRALWDDEALYLAYDVIDNQLNASVTTRDGGVWNEDSVEWAIDTLNDDGGSANSNSDFMRPDDYHGIISILNTLYDSQGTVSGTPSSAWNGNWQSAVQLHGTNNNNSDTDTGYTVEVKIPWTSIGYPGAPSVDTMVAMGFALNDKDASLSGFAMWPQGGGSAFENAANWGKALLSSETVDAVTIDGNIVTESIDGILGVAMSGAYCSSTDADGYYRCLVPSGWSGTITPSKNLYTFDPPNRNYNRVTSDYNDDYTGTPQSASIVYVGPTGFCGAGNDPCYDNIQDGVNAVNEDGTVKVAQGVYHENLDLVNDCIIQGGWDSSFASREDDPSLTVINGDLDGDGSGDGPVFYHHFGGTFTIEGFTIRNGTYGFKLHYLQELSLLNNSIVDNNTGVFSSLFGGTMHVLNNTITGNNTGLYIGAGAYLAESGWYDSFADLNNNMVIGNDIGIDALAYGSYCTPPWAYISLYFNSANNTISGNNVGIRSSVNPCESSLNANLQNDIVWGNSADDIIIIRGEYFGCPWNENNLCVNENVYVSASYSVIGNVNDTIVGHYSDDGANVHADPLFINPSNGDYHLSLSSPLIDQGNNAVPSLPFTDFEGDPRVINCAADIGADEFNPATGLWHEIPDSFTPGGRPFTSTCTESWWYGQDSTGNYETGSANSGSLITPPYDISAGQALSFWSWEATEFSADYDTRKVLISADMGAAWQELMNLSGTEQQWYRVEVPLEAYAGQTVLFKFAFDTVDELYNNYAGWYLDEIKVEECSTTYYMDFDGDGYGDPDRTILSCILPPDGYVSDNSDCDDRDPYVHAETLWYPDADGDGYGNPAISIQQCSRPAGPLLYVLNSTDYDDSDPHIYPGGPAARITGQAPAYYLTLQDAYNAAGDGDIIQCQAVSYTEDLFINSNKSVLLACGYDAAFTAVSANATLNGSITVSGGSITIENFVLQ